MKRIFKIAEILIITVVFIHCCVYRSITHLNHDELGWVKNRHEGEIMYFRSQNGDLDTVKILEIAIRNSLDPFNWAYFNTSVREYVASADVRYAFNRFHNSGGILSISKDYQDRPIFFSSILINGWLHYIPLETTSLQIDSITMNDIMFFDNGKLDSIHKRDSIPILSYSWSKKYGLVQYTFQDGTVFSRIFE